jgi:hypothetical protein
VEGSDGLSGTGVCGGVHSGDAKAAGTGGAAAGSSKGPVTERWNLCSEDEMM